MSPSGALGTVCTLAADCASGFCVDGVCCNNACNAGACDACSVSAGATTNGTCQLLTGPVCDDGNACTQTDACIAGACVGANPKACPAPDACHTAGTCNPVTGQCVNPENPEGTLCDDGNRCTLSDTCVAGVCKAGVLLTCMALDECHDAGICDSVTGKCSNPVKADGSICSTGQCEKGVCTVSSTSSSSSGMGGSGASGGAGGNGASSSSSSSGMGGNGASSSSSSSGMGGNGASGGTGGNGGSVETGGVGGIGAAGGSEPRPPIIIDRGCGCSVEDSPERGLAWAVLASLFALKRRRRSMQMRG